MAGIGHRHRLLVLVASPGPSFGDGGSGRSRCGKTRLASTSEARTSSGVGTPGRWRPMADISAHPAETAEWRFACQAYPTKIAKHPDAHLQEGKPEAVQRAGAIAWRQ